MQEELIDGVPAASAAVQCEVPEQLDEMLSNHLPLGLLTDLAAYALPLAAAVKLQLLGECRVRHRAETLLDEVEILSANQAEKAALVFPRRLATIERLAISAATPSSRPEIE